MSTMTPEREAIVRGQLLSVNEAAIRLAVTPGRVRQLLIRGELDGIKLNEKAWMIRLADLSRYARSVGKTLVSAG